MAGVASPPGRAGAGGGHRRAKRGGRAQRGCNTPNVGPRFAWPLGRYGRALRRGMPAPRAMRPIGHPPRPNPSRFDCHSWSHDCNHFCLLRTRAICISGVASAPGLHVRWQPMSLRPEPIPYLTPRRRLHGHRTHLGPSSGGQSGIANHM